MYSLMNDRFVGVSPNDVYAAILFEGAPRKGIFGMKRISLGGVLDGESSSARVTT